MNSDWVGGKLEYHDENRTPIGVHNIIALQHERGLSNEQLKSIHIEALYNLLAQLYIDRKTEESKLLDSGLDLPGDKYDNSWAYVDYFDYTLKINNVIKQLENLGKNPKKDEELRYGWIYPDANLLPTYKTLYDVAIKKKFIHPIRDPVNGKIYQPPEICYISQLLKDWIKRDGYYSDRKREWKNTFSSEDGYQELCLFSRAIQHLLNKNMEIMRSKYPDNEIDRIIEKGVKIYDEKPSSKKPGKKVTWSQDEYANLGLQREYIRYKSIQRFTETWEMLRRANENK